MKNLKNFYIDGRWVTPNSTTTLPVLNPATEEQVGTITLGNVTDVNIAVASAKKAFESFSQTTKEERLALLYRLKEVTEKRLEDLAQAMRIEMGAPISMSRDAQADAAIGHLDSFIEALENLEEQQTLSNGDVVMREPIGVCGLITPWNWPMNQIALKVIPALATGCTCVLKPSEHTPISAMLYAEIIHEAGYPPGVFNVIQGYGDVGAKLVSDPRVDKVSLTGSAETGKKVYSSAALGMKNVTMELGGKSPNLVFTDCDLESQITASVSECMLNTGQSCDAPTRLLVERECYGEVVEIAKRAAEAIKVCDPELEGDHLGPLFDRIQFDRVQAMISVGIGEGATLLTGGLGKPQGLETGYFVKPTIFTDVNNDMQIAREEVFGPVLCMIPFDTEEQAIAIANDTVFGLTNYIQTQDSAKANRVARRLRSGMVQMNGTFRSAGAPFGGYKQSGNGREGGVWGLEDFLEVKSISGWSNA